VTSAPDKDLAVVGQSVPKVDAMGLACGLEPYVADFDVGDALCGYIVPSPHAHARIRKIDASKARAMEGVHAVLTFQDLPRNAHTTAGQGYPEPSPYDSFVLDDKVRFVGDKVALVVADTREIAEAAGRALEIEWEVLPAVLDPDHAMDPGAPVVHDEPEASMPIPVPYDPKRNLAAAATMGAGELAKALSSSHLVHRGTWRTHYVQHCALETHGCLGWLDAKDRLVLVSATQVPFHARRITAQALGIPVRRVRVIKPRIGGGFGSKQEVMLEQCVGAMVLTTRRKVLLKLTRQEEFLSDAPPDEGQPGGRLRGRRVRQRRAHGGAEQHRRLRRPRADRHDPQRQQGPAAVPDEGRLLRRQCRLHQLRWRRLPRLRREAGRLRHGVLPGRGAEKLKLDPVELRRRNTSGPARVARVRGAGRGRGRRRDDGRLLRAAGVPRAGGQGHRLGAKPAGPATARGSAAWGCAR
jgi:CO/xanthine dehydrogenase Mo-binding subunit